MKNKSGLIVFGNHVGELSLIVIEPLGFIHCDVLVY